MVARRVTAAAGRHRRPPRGRPPPFLFLTHEAAADDEDNGRRRLSATVEAALGGGGSMLLTVIGVPCAGALHRAVYSPLALMDHSSGVRHLKIFDRAGSQLYGEHVCYQTIPISEIWNYYPRLVISSWTKQ